MVVGNDDFHNTVTMVTVMSQLNADREKHHCQTRRGHADTHMHTPEAKRKHAEPKGKAECTHTSSRHALPHLGPIYFTSLQQSIRSNTPHYEERTTSVDNGVKQ